MNGDLISWMARLFKERTVERVTEGNVTKRHPVEATIPQGSQVSSLLVAINTSGLIRCMSEWISEVEGQAFADDVGQVATGSNINQVFRKLEVCARVSIDWAERQ